MAKVTGYLEKAGTGYRMRAVIGYKSDGSAKRKSKMAKGKTQREAYKELDKWLEDLENIKGDPDLLDITFKDFYENYWKKQAQINLEPKTYTEYVRQIKNRFLDKLGFIPLSDIKPYMIKDIVINAKRVSKNGDTSSNPLTRNTRMRMLFAVNNVFLIAQKEYDIIQENPVSKVTIPPDKGAKKNVYEPYSETEIADMMNALENETLEIKALILTAFITGAREGEIVALEEKDLNFEAHEICFHQRISELSSNEVLLLPGLKNSDNQKIVSVPPHLLDLLKELSNENKKLRWNLNIKKPQHTFLFDTLQDGTLPRGSYLYKKFKRFTKRNGLRHIRFHDLRHTSATYLLSNPNMTTKELQHRLGHRDYNTTVNTYAHALKKKKDTATEIFEELIK